jgi:GT2 family glycosyltransferase
MGGWNHTGTRQVDQPYGACLLIRRSILDEVGLMDERFFMYYDEVDLCYRIKKSGGRVYFTDAITVIHHANQSSSQIALDCERYKDRSRLLFFAKHYGAWSVCLLAINLAVKTILVWPVFGLSYTVIRRPRDPEHFKAPIRIMWGEIARFFKWKR